jgi:predicted branched-subunit amino acid permease
MAAMRAAALRLRRGYGTGSRSAMQPTRTFETSRAAFAAGVRTAWTSVFAMVMSGTYVGIGALAHDAGLSALWLTMSTVVVWAGPAQVIMVSAIGGGATMFEVALAVTLSAMRLLPMVVALLPLLRRPGRGFGELLLPTHFTSVSMWVESFRLLPSMEREHRVAFCNGLSSGFMAVASVFGLVGYYLAAGLPTLFAGGLLFLTPVSFLISTARNATAMIDRLALVLGLIIGPVLVYFQVGLDIMWTGISAGTVAYAVHRLRGAAA